ncbi:nucleolar protein 58-like [Pomacea canaliculata]|uniref:nucleolar protein 58-like n=1 Tax=Pomacea canaliculata TaxID=400727 RepID=UPI000D737DE5|nr:nucleolar protein 58-like [Pomacea canaliculata]
MLVLFETAAGYAVFKVLSEKKLKHSENLYLDFQNPESAAKIVKLKHFQKFKDMTDALAGATAAVEGKISKTLKKVLKKLGDVQEDLAVSDAKLGSLIKDKFQFSCVSNSAIQELMRCIRSQMESLIVGLPDRELSAMSLGLAHSLSRYKLKFSPDKVDTMIVQAISLLDDLDKELNNYIMRAREWYGWHFPELTKIVTDNFAFARTVIAIGDKVNAAKCDLSKILPEEVEQEVKDAAEISMGTEISEDDIMNIKFLCEQVIEISEYRAKLYDYLKNRMIAIAPNLTVLVGELVGARLISHAGSLLNLAKHPSSTVQILGAEKALFRALKSKHDTPKYGLIYHASLVGQTTAKNKGKLSRMLAAKAALAIRVDALGEGTDCELGEEHKAKLMMRMQQLEDKSARRISGTGKMQAKWERYENKSQVFTYNTAADSTLPSVSKKRKLVDGAEERPSKLLKIEPVDGAGDASAVEPAKKKKKKHQEEDADHIPDLNASQTSSDATGEKKKKKKKKKHAEDTDD